MNKHLKDLIQIAYFDKQIDDLEPKIAQVRYELDEKIKQEKDMLKHIEKLGEQSRHIDTEIARHDANIQEISAKLEQIAKKQKDIKTEKEMRALDVETDIAKENMTHSNAEIQRLEALKESHQKESQSYAPKLEVLQVSIKELEAQTQEQVDNIKKEQKKLFDQKEALIAKMDAKIVGFYAKIRRWAQNSSVVPVFKQACGGCFIRLNDTIYNEILKGNSIVNCPHCGRILYVKESEQHNATPTKDSKVAKPKRKTKL